MSSARIPVREAAKAWLKDPSFRAERSCVRARQSRSHGWKRASTTPTIAGSSADGGVFFLVSPSAEGHPETLRPLSQSESSFARSSHKRPVRSKG